MTYSQIIRWPLRATLGAITLAMIVGAGEASAQGVDTAGVAAKLGPVTRVLAIGNLTPKATPAALPAVLAREVPATLELYLAGKIDGWYARPDQTGELAPVVWTAPRWI